MRAVAGLVSSWLLLAVPVLIALPARPAAAAAPAQWEQWQHLAGVFDLAGPRSDGKLVAAASGRLYLLDPAGTLTAFAAGPGGYAAKDGPESYIAFSSGWHVAAAGCDFPADTLYVLRLKAPLGVDRVDSRGQTSGFADVPGVDSLNGITFDSAGSFGHRLLVTGPRAGRTVVDAIDCRGVITTLTDSAPPVEGGIAVAPAGFGSHGGHLIAPDEGSGRVFAIAPDGTSSILVESGLPAGGDIGVESLGFVPPGFAAGGQAYLADRVSPGNAHPGTDSVLRLGSEALVAAGVAEGDLLVSTEASGTTIAVRCAARCTVTRVAEAAPQAHIEGRLLLLTRQPQPAPSALPEASGLGSGYRLQQALRLAAIALGALATVALVGLAVGLIRRRRGLWLRNL
jgi:hypothetical protein